MLNINLFLLLVLVLGSVTACVEEERFYPKPTGYFRIDLPEKRYLTFNDTLCPFVFDIPDYAHPVKRTDEFCWYNLEIPRYKATIHLSYKIVDNNLPFLTEDSRLLVMKHISKAGNIKENLILDTLHHVYGTVYELTGNVGSVMQFHLTDSSKHFLRGSLYFNVVPNADSLQPVAEYLKTDIYRLIETFQWK